MNKKIYLAFIATILLFIAGCASIQTDIVGKATLTAGQCSYIQPEIKQPDGSLQPSGIVMQRLDELKSIKGCSNPLLPICSEIDQVKTQLNVFYEKLCISGGGTGWPLPDPDACIDSDADSDGDGVPNDFGDSLFIPGSAVDAAGITKMDYCTIVEDKSLEDITLSGYKQGNMLVEYSCDNGVIAEHHVVGACAEGKLLDFTGGIVPAGAVCYDSDPNRQTLLVTSRGTQGSVRTISGEWYTDTCFMDIKLSRWLKWDYYCEKDVLKVETLCSCDRDTGTALVPEKCGVS